MLQVTGQSRILVGVDPIDFRKRLDGTAGHCRRHFLRDPLDGAIYVFRNKRSTMIRIYFFDGLVEWGCDLRIAKGTFPHWPSSDSPLQGIKAHQLYLLLKGGNPDSAQVLPEWRKLA